MERTILPLEIGRIAVHVRRAGSGRTPVILLHGVYFDHHLWDRQIGTIADGAVIAVDMPLHGHSREGIKPDWTLSDCAGMLIEILDRLQIGKVIAVGHSWGSMTILRAASRQPGRFQAIGLCNMPFRAPTKKEARTIRLQHLALPFRRIYMRQAARSLMSAESLKADPGLVRSSSPP